jgi:hypothetical protein
VGDTNLILGEGERIRVVSISHVRVLSWKEGDMSLICADYMHMNQYAHATGESVPRGHLTKFATVVGREPTGQRTTKQTADSVHIGGNESINDLRCSKEELLCVCLTIDWLDGSLS